MDARIGNQFWKARSSHGRKPLFATPELLWDACCQYFEWNEDNPLHEAKAMAFQGSSWIEYVPKMRVMTLTACQRFIGMDDQTWREYREKKDFSGVCAEVEQIIKDQKFAGASAGLFNPMIIARDLGLRESTAVDHSSTDGTMTPTVITRTIVRADGSTEEL